MCKELLNTGMKDSNGYDIHNHDIVRMSSNNSEVFGLVYYDKSKAAFRFVNGNFLYIVKESGVKMEVVGNKFDNPEYLNKILKYNDTKKN